MSEISNIRTNPFDSSVSWRTMDTEIGTIAELDELPGIYGFRLKDRPRQGYITVSENPTGGSVFTIVTTAPNAGQVRIDYNSGLLVFNVADNGTECAVDYDGGGSVASKENIQETVNAATELVMPIGAIIFIAPGYFSATGNGGSWTCIHTNTVAGLKTYLTDNGYTNFKVCDGLELNDVDSPIYNGAGRYLPDLTDSRFLRGSTTSGGVANSSGSATSANESAHTHTMQNHTHSIPNHQHSLTGDTAWAQIVMDAGTDVIEMRANTSVTSYTGNRTVTLSENITSTGSSRTSAAAVSGTTSTDGSSTSGAPSNNTTAAGSAHNHTITVSSVEPKYLAGWYIMRVK